MSDIVLTMSNFAHFPKRFSLCDKLFPAGGYLDVSTFMVLRVLRKHLILYSCLVILLFGFLWRLNLAKTSCTGEPSKGDYSTHVRAVSDLIAGKNPYEWTIASYNNLENDPTNKGYAYFPGILYVNCFLYIFSLITSFSFNLSSFLFDPIFLFKLPGIVSNLGVGIFLLVYFYYIKKDKLAALFSVSFWTFNFYFVLKNSLAGFDSVPVLFMLLSLYYLSKDDILSGFFFALSVLFKTFPVILFPLFLFRSKKPLKFLLAGFTTAFFFSIPFMRSWQDFWIYIQGALLVHGHRFVQGRPFLYYISYYYSVELFRIIPFGFYSLSSIFSGWVLIGLNKFITTFKKITFVKNKYAVAMLPFISFYTLTPVLNRTYLLWAVPVFLLGGYNFFKRKKVLVLFYLFNIFYWGFCYWYLAQWHDGFHIWHQI